MKVPRSSPADLLGRSSLTARQIALVLVAVVLAVVLVPASSGAASAFLNVIITDKGRVNQATVDADGALHVRGDVAATAPVATTAFGRNFIPEEGPGVPRDTEVLAEPITTSLITFSNVGPEDDGAEAIFSFDGGSFTVGGTQNGSRLPKYLALTQPVTITQILVRCFGCNIAIDLVGTAG